jgi:hypothetical protein
MDERSKLDPHILDHRMALAGMPQIPSGASNDRELKRRLDEPAMQLDAASSVFFTSALFASMYRAGPILVAIRSAPVCPPLRVRAAGVVDGVRRVRCEHWRSLRRGE